MPEKGGALIYNDWCPYEKGKFGLTQEELAVKIRLVVPGKTLP